MIYNIVSKIIVEDATFASRATYIILNLLKLFEKETMFSDMTIKLVKLLLSVHYANSKKIALKRKSLANSRN